MSHVFHLPSETSSPIAAGRAVLDTQVVLDWLVFRDPGVSALARAIQNGSLHWLASQPMLEEIEQVLDRGVGAAWSPDRALIRDVCHRTAIVTDVATRSALQCTDPDDQMFIDLALAAGADWLFTRDKALLRLARKRSANAPLPGEPGEVYAAAGGFGAASAMGCTGARQLCGSSVANSAFLSVGSRSNTSFR